jgi:hypothetical protein
MKKKSPSQSAFFNPRALIGLFVCFAGVLIAFFAFGTQPQGTASDENTMTRQELVEMYRSAAPADFVPPACVAGSEMFTDVPASNPFCSWIEELARRGITGGCTPTMYCPAAAVTRQQMAVFLIRTQEGAKSRFAVVNSDATLARGRGVVSVEPDPLLGRYHVIFDTDTTGCAYIGTVGNPGTGATDGFITTALLAGTTNGVFVRTFDATGVITPRNFHLQLVCP